MGDALAKLRSWGWMVAVHNDYRQGGQLRTFWLFTHPDGRWIKGEGFYDVDALDECLRQAAAPPPLQEAHGMKPGQRCTRTAHEQLGGDHAFVAAHAKEWDRYGDDEGLRCLYVQPSAEPTCDIKAMHVGPCGASNCPIRTDLKPRAGKDLEWARMSGVSTVEACLTCGATPATYECNAGHAFCRPCARGPCPTCAPPATERAKCPEWCGTNPPPGIVSRYWSGGDAAPHCFCSKECATAGRCLHPAPKEPRHE